jgi:hypothetical protein
MTDETNLALPESGGFPASDTPETETVAPDTTPDVAEDSETNETPEKPKGGFQRRIAELVEQRNEERRAREATERRLDQLVEMMASQREAPPAPKAPEAPPTLEQHGYDEKQYQTALLEYAKAEARREAQEALKADRAAQQAEARQATFKTREAEFLKATPDYQAVVYDPTAPISPTMAEIIAESDVGPQLAYHLAKNRDVARSIYNLPPTAAARELGRIEARLSQPKEPPRTSSAPPPAPKVEAVEPEVERDPDKMSVTEWLKWREKSLKRRG